MPVFPELFRVLATEVYLPIKMGYSAAVWDCKAAVEMTKDWNGIDHVVLRGPQGASVRVGIVHFTMG